jgi:colicin import membrane protein
MQMKTASVISTGLHILVLAWATFSFTGKTFEVTPAESLPVDLVTEKQFSEITKGVKDAPKPKPEEKPKPLVEKKADQPPPKPVDELKPKIDEKKEVALNKEAAPPDEPDPIKDKLEKAKETPQEAKADPQPLPPRKPPPPPKHKEPKFDADKIAALLDKRDPTRSAIVGNEVSDKPTLGLASGNAANLSQSEIDALRRRIASCWSIPAGAEDAANLTVVFRVIFRRDGTIERGPDAVEGSVSPFGPAFADSGRRAILQCQPYTMLNPAHYDTWKDIEIGFKPSDMFK